MDIQTTHEGGPQIQEKFEKLTLSEKLPNFKTFQAKRKQSDAYAQSCSLGTPRKTAGKGSNKLAARSSKMVQTFPDAGAWIYKTEAAASVVDYSEVTLDEEIKNYETRMLANRKMTIFDFYEDQEC